MKNEMKRVVLINSSPKIGEASVSGKLTAMLEKQMLSEGHEVNLVDVRKTMTRLNEAFNLIAQDTKNDGQKTMENRILPFF